MGTEVQIYLKKNGQNIDESCHVSYTRAIVAMWKIMVRILHILIIILPYYIIQEAVPSYSTFTEETPWTCTVKMR